MHRISITPLFRLGIYQKKDISDDNIYMSLTVKEFFKKIMTMFLLQQNCLYCNAATLTPNAMLCVAMLKMGNRKI